MKGKKGTRRGDTLEVKVRDIFYNPIYKNEVNAQSYRELACLIEDLKNNGIDIEKAIEKRRKDLSWW